MSQNKSFASIFMAFLILAMTVLSVACREASAAPQINTASFTAYDYEFDGPDVLTAGWTRLELVNKGPDYHHIQLVQLDDGKTVDDLLAAFQESPVLPNWAAEFGGPNPPEAGAISEAYVSLIPGNYVLICTVPDKNGVPHVQHGMVKSIRVEQRVNEVTIEPEADVVLDMLDFSYELSAPLTAGKQVIRVNNKGQQAHEVFLARLAPGRTVNEFLGSFTPDAPAELRDWEGLGGLSVIEPNAHGYFTADLELGNYLLICFAPESSSGAPHFMMGMAQEFTIE